MAARGPVWQFASGDAMDAHRARRRFALFLSEYGDLRSDFAAAELIYGELVANVVRHAPGPIAIRLDWSGVSPCLHVHDRGGGFTWEPALPSDPLDERRRGLYLVSTLGSNFTATPRRGHGMCVMVTLPVVRVADGIPA